MIKFQGEISSKCLKYITRCNAKFAHIGGFIGGIILGIPISVAVFTIHWGFSIICFLLFCVVLPLLGGIAPTKKDLGYLVPSIVIVNSDTQEIVCESDKFHIESSFSLVTEVWDFGEWYDIRTEVDAGKFICDKSLICEGTLEEFESLFAGKIIKKHKK